LQVAAALANGTNSKPCAPPQRALPRTPDLAVPTGHAGRAISPHQTPTSPSRFATPPTATPTPAPRLPIPAPDLPSASAKLTGGATGVEPDDESDEYDEVFERRFRPLSAIIYAPLMIDDVEC